MTIVGGMTLIEFLEARIAEDEAEAKPMAALEDDDRGGWAIVYAERVLAECAAKRAIIKQHEDWPVLVERESEISHDASDLNSVTFRMSRETMWLTEREYVKRFGVEPPTAPMIRILAAVYKDHPDYQQEWAL